MSLSQIMLATREDLPQVIAIEQRAFQMPWSLQDYLDCLQVGDQLWLQKRDDEIIGYLLLRLVADEGEILSIAINPDFQRQGHGQRLLQSGIQRARERDCQHLFLEVREANVAAQALYLAAGFVVVGKRKNYYQNTDASREDALVMELDLVAS